MKLTVGIIRAVSLNVALTVLTARAEAEPPRTLSIAVTLAEDGDFIQAMLAARQAGARATTLSIFWDEAMVAGHYAPKVDWLVTARSFYPTIWMKLALVLPVIDTVADRRPADLQGLAWDDPAVLAAFEVYATAVITRLKGGELASISIGNEVDARLVSAPN